MEMHGKCFIFLVVSIETLMGQYNSSFTVTSHIEISENETASQRRVKASECNQLSVMHRAVSYNYYLAFISLVPIPVLTIR